MGIQENGYWNPNKFESLKTLLEETQEWEIRINTPQPWQDSYFKPDPCFIEVAATGERMTVAEALQRISPEDLASPAGQNTTDTSSMPIFLGGNVKYWIKLQSYYDKHTGEKERIEPEIQENNPNARFYVCEFLQDQYGHIHFSSVITGLNTKDRVVADRHASYTMSQRMKASGKNDPYNGIIVARLAASSEEARAGHFLDEE